MDDHLDSVLAQWAAVRPDVDAAPMAVVGALGRASAAVDARLARTFAEYGLDAATFDVLATLVRSGEPNRLTPAALAADAMITTSAVAQRLNRVVERGFARRIANPDDGRSTLVELTDSGRAAVESVLPAHLETEQAILADLDADERATLRSLLSRVRSNALG